MAKNKVRLALFAAFFAQVIFGFSFMATKIALNTASPLTVIANRYIVATIALTFVLFAGKFKLSLKGKSIWKVLLMSLFQPVLYFIFESYGIDMTTSSFSSVMIALIPVVSVFTGSVLLREKPGAIQLLFTLLSVGGVLLVALKGEEKGTVTLPGALLLFGAVLTSALYNTVSRKISKEFTVFERTYIQTLTGLFWFMILALIESAEAPLKVFSGFAEGGYVLSLLYLGIMSSVVAFLLLNFANTHIPVAKTTAFSNLTTVVSVIAGAVFLNERLGSLKIAGVIMIIIGVWGATKMGKEEKNEKITA